MLKATILTWIIAISGSVFLGILLIVQMIMLINPRGRKTKDLLIGEGKEWHDHTHFRIAYAFAWADWIIIMPTLLIGNIAVLLGLAWGYIIWIALGVLCLYFSILFWVFEKEYTYPSAGPFAYYTYYWGVYVYWGIGVLAYSIIRLNGAT